MTIRPFPPALVGETAGHRRAQVAWDALVTRLRALNRLGATGGTRAELESAYLRSITPILIERGIIPNAAGLQAILDDVNRRGQLFSDAFNAYLRDPGTFAPEMRLTAPGGTTEERVGIPDMPRDFRMDITGARADVARAREWRSLVERLRVAGYTTLDTPENVMRAFLRSQGRTQEQVDALTGTATEGTLYDAFWGANGYHRGPLRHGPTGTALVTTPIDVRLPTPDERVDPGTLNPRYQAMTAALRGLNRQEQATVNGFFTPSGALATDTARQGHPRAHRAAQALAVQILGGTPEAAARRVREALNRAPPGPGQPPDPMRPYIDALRRTLGIADGQPATDAHLAAITARLSDHRVGQATDLALMLAGHHTVGTDTGNTMLQEWAGRQRPVVTLGTGAADSPLLPPNAFPARGTGHTHG